MAAESEYKILKEFSVPDPFSVPRHELQARLTNLERLFGMLVGQIIGQVTLNPELLIECAKMNRLNRSHAEIMDEQVQDPNKSIAEASRENLLRFAVELGVPDKALPQEPVQPRQSVTEAELYTNPNDEFPRD